MPSDTKSRWRVLTLSRNYPNRAFGNLGLWVQRQVQQLARNCDIVVVSPVPYCPAIIPSSYYRSFRLSEAYEEHDGVSVWHPRFLLAPGQAFQSLEAASYYFATRRLCDRIRRHFRFDLIHAHFTYPDGVVAALMGRRYGIPVVVTEHAFWRPWLEEYPLVRSQVIAASRRIDAHIAVSERLRDSMASFTKDRDRIQVVPNGVDGSIFTPAKSQAMNPNQVLFVGHLNYVKGVDILFEAFARLLTKRPSSRLVLVGGASYRDTQLQERQLRQLMSSLRIADKVEFAGIKGPHQVASYIRESAMLVLPSRRETFGAVLVEALACGTPVVATHCGGPDDFVTNDVGLLVTPEDPGALADAIEQVLATRDSYNAEILREFALKRFALDLIAGKILRIYDDLMGSQFSTCQD